MLIQAMTMASLVLEGIYLRADAQQTQTYNSLSRMSIPKCFLLKNLRELVYVSKCSYPCATSRISILDLA